MLSKKAKEAIKANPVLQGRLAEALKNPDGSSRSTTTIMRWIYNNDTIMLTTAVAMDIIREVTGLQDEEILEQQSAA